MIIENITTTITKCLHFGPFYLILNNIGMHWCQMWQEWALLSMITTLKIPMENSEVKEQHGLSLLDQHGTMKPNMLDIKCKLL